MTNTKNLVVVAQTVTNYFCGRCGKHRGSYKTTVEMDLESGLTYSGSLDERIHFNFCETCTKLSIRLRETHACPHVLSTAMDEISRIEAYLSGAMPYSELTDAERNAICAAREGNFVHPIFLLVVDIYGTPRFSVSNYLTDGTAALRLVGPSNRWARSLHYDPMLGYVAIWEPGSVCGFGSTMCEAIVAANCTAAQSEWPYKVKEVAA